MAKKNQVEYIRGKLYWPKVLGEPVDNYGKDGKEWVFDLSLDDSGVKQAKSYKVQGKPALNIKDKGDEKGKFLTFKQKYRKLATPDKDGNDRWTKAPRVADKNGGEWDQDTKLGNGTVADVKFEIVDYGPGKFPGIYPQAIRILDHVPYGGNSDFEKLSEDDEYFSRPEPTYEGRVDRDDDLDDDIL